MTSPDLDQFDELERRYLVLLDRCAAFEAETRAELAGLRSRVDRALAERPFDAALRRALTHSGW